MGDLIRQDSNDTGHVSFIYKKKNFDPVYEVPVVPSITSSLPRTPAPSTPKPKKKQQNDFYDKLAENLSQTTQCLRLLAKDLDHIDEEARNVRGHKSPVEIRVTFIRVIDVDTCKQVFKAEVFLQAKWSEPLLLGKTQKELDQYDLRKLWDPLVSISNVVGELEEDKKWRLVVAEEPGYKYPTMYFRRRMLGTFVERLELKSFPVDVQALTLKVVSERATEEVDLFEDGKVLSSVYTENFSDEHEWLIYEHVESECATMTPADESTLTIPGLAEVLSDSFKHPQADFTCHVARRPGYFLWNIILIVFLLISLSFSAWAISANQPEYRIVVLILLLVAAVSYRLVMTKHLPAMSYITYLDLYVIVSLIFIGLQVVAVCGISVPARKEALATDNIDRYVGFGMAIAWALFNVIYLAYLFILGAIERQKMLDKDSVYVDRKDKLSRRRPKNDFRPEPRAQPRYESLPQPPPKEQHVNKIVYINAQDTEQPVEPVKGRKKKEKKRKPTPVEKTEQEEKVYTVVPLT